MDRIPPAPARHTWELGKVGCRIGRDPRGLPLDFPAMMSIWTLQSWFSFRIVAIWLGMWVARRYLYRQVIAVMESQQLRALNRYYRQFDECQFTPISLDQVLPPEVLHLLTGVPASLGSRRVIEVYAVEPKSSNATLPAAFTTFYFTQQPPVVFSPVRADELTSYQKFILFHEVAHATGIQTSHRTAAPIILLDCITIAMTIMVIGLQSNLAWIGLIAYALVRLTEAALSVGSRGAVSAVEMFADAVAFWAHEIADGQEAVARVRRIRAKHLNGVAVSAASSAKLAAMEKATAKYLADQRAQYEQYRDALERQETSNGEFIVEQRHPIGFDKTEMLYRQETAIEIIDPSFGLRQAINFGLLLVGQLVLILLAWNMDLPSFAEIALCVGMPWLIAFVLRLYFLFASR